MPRVTKNGEIEPAQSIDVRELSNGQLKNLVKNPKRKKNKDLVRKLKLSNTIVGGALGAAIAKNKIPGALIGSALGYGAGEAMLYAGDKLHERDARIAEKELNRRKHNGK